MNLSHNDQLLMGNAGTPDIQPNSAYDQSITFEDSESSGDIQAPSGYSPRPGQDFNNILGADNGSDDHFGGFGSNFTSLRDSGGLGSGGFGGYDNSPTGFGAGSFNNSPTGFGGDGFGDYSPRPGQTDTMATSSPELAQLFSLITQFQPPPIEISPHFKPFLPDLVPAIGAIDAFIKVPRPDDETEPLGLTVLDEPTIGCSDPHIIQMQLREKYGIVTNNEGDGYIGAIKDLEHNQKALDTFLENYEEIVRERPAPSMVYSHKMPDLNELMQLFPEQLEEALGNIPLPSADIDLSLEEYAKVICAFLDIPVKGNIIESLHVMFTLFNTFEENQHFNIPGGSLRNSVSAGSNRQ